MDELVALVAEAHAAWEPRLARAVFGTDDPAVVARALSDGVAAAVGVPVTGVRFYEPGVGVVVGLELADGRAVVGKVHRRSSSSPERLAAVARIQAAVADAGVPAPRPLGGPSPLGEGWLMVEELRAGSTADGYDPVVRQAIAGALARFVAAARPRVDDPGVVPWLREPVIDGLWPEPHDLRFDFPSTAAGAEWIDDAARAARTVIDADRTPPVVGHLDWRQQNLGFTGAEVTAIYDWDSVAAVPEPLLVGVTSVIHPVDWRERRADPLPTLEQVDGFVGDYETAAGVRLDAELVGAGQRWATAYGARCMHSDTVLALLPGVDPTLGWPRLLRQLLAR